MTDNLVFVCFVFILFQEIRRTGEGNLRNIFLYFVGRHTDTVIPDDHRLIFGVDDHFNLQFFIFRNRIFAHHIQFL